MRIAPSTWPARVLFVLICVPLGLALALWLWVGVLIPSAQNTAPRAVQSQGQTDLIPLHV